MPINIGAFRAELVGGGARSCLFEIFIPGLQKFSMMAESASLPGRTFETIAVPYFGRTYKIPGGTTFSDWKITVINDEDFMCRSYIEQWMNQINTHVSNVRLKSETQLQQNLDVLQYGKDGRPIKSYKLIHAWPSSLGDITLGWSDTKIETFDVTFDYSWWESSTVEHSSSGLTGSVSIPYIG